MTRLIPGKTNVQIELFRGITLGDILVAGAALTMLIFVFISNLPYKFYICLAVALIAGGLLIRVGEQANYLYLLHIFSHFGYDRRFARHDTDTALMERMENQNAETAEHNPSGGLSGGANQVPPESKAEKKKRLKAEKASEKKRKKERKREDRILKNKKVPQAEKDAILARREAEAREDEISRSVRKSVDAVFDTMSKKERAESKKERRANEKARVRARKEEDKRLKSKTVLQAEKDAIRARRAKESENAMRRLLSVKAWTQLLVLRQSGTG